jgi:hypothetical protein
VSGPKPARRASGASLPDTESIQIPAAHISRKTRVAGHAFIAKRACVRRLVMNCTSAMRWRIVAAS